MSKFSLAQEDFDSSDTIEMGAVQGSGEPVQYMDAGELTAVEDDHLDIQRAGTDVDRLVDAEEKVSDLEEVVEHAVEDNGLSQEALTQLHLAMKRIVGPNLTKRRIPSMESALSFDKHEVARIALEGVKETLKQFWEAIKNNTSKFWNMTKSWYIKTFDVSNKLISRAKALDEKSSSVATSANEKSFDFNGANVIAVNYSVKEPSQCIAGLGGLKTLVESILQNVTKQNQNNKTDALVDSMERLIKMVRSQLTQTEARENAAQSGSDAKNFGYFFNETKIGEALQSCFASDTPFYDEITKLQSDPEMVKKLGIDPQRQQYQVSAPLPGNKSFFVIKAAPNAQAPKTLETPEQMGIFLESIKGIRWLLADSSAKTREMNEESTVKTLNTSQMQQIAEDVLAIGETIQKYKREFEARDKYYQNTLKGFDRIMNSMNEEAIEYSANNKDEQHGVGVYNSTTKVSEQTNKMARYIGKEVINIFKKNMTISGAVINHAVKVCIGFLSYGERSLAQYGN